MIASIILFIADIVMVIGLCFVMFNMIIGDFYEAQFVGVLLILLQCLLIRVRIDK